MKKKTIVWLLIGAFLVLLGCAVFGGVMMALKWNFANLSTAKYETNSYDFSEKVENISVVTDTADVIFVPSSDSELHVVCYETENLRHIVTKKDGALVVELSDTRKWYEYIGINFASPKITVALPASEYGEIEIKVSTGIVKLDGVKCEKLTSKGSTGDIFMKDVIVGERIFVERDTGDINFDACDAREIFAKTSTGDIKGSLLTDKMFVAGTDTGKISVPKNGDGGRCKLTTDTGNIKIEIK